MITHPELVAKLTKSGEDILNELTAWDCNIWHMSSCICSEAGELFDAIKRPVIYRKPLDRANVIEELGDLEFYMEGLRQAMDISRQETLDANILKLTKRYNELKYSDKKAAERADKVLAGVGASAREVEQEAARVDAMTPAGWDKAKPGTDKTVTQIRKVAVVHHLHAGQAPCGIQGVPKVWPAGHLWSAYWEEVDCPDCLKYKPGIQKVDKSPSRRPAGYDPLLPD